MSNLNELHQAAVVAAEALRKIQAQAASERTEENDYQCSRETRMAQKEAHKVYNRAMSAFQNAIEELPELPKNLKELYDQIGEVKTYA